MRAASPCDPDALSICYSSITYQRAIQWLICHMLFVYHISTVIRPSHINQTMTYWQCYSSFTYSSITYVIRLSHINQTMTYCNITRLCDIWHCQYVIRLSHINQTVWHITHAWCIVNMLLDTWLIMYLHAIRYIVDHASICY